MPAGDDAKKEAKVSTLNRMVNFMNQIIISSYCLFKHKLFKNYISIFNFHFVFYLIGWKIR